MHSRQLNSFDAQPPGDMEIWDSKNGDLEYRHVLLWHLVQGRGCGLSFFVCLHCRYATLYSKASFGYLVGDIKYRLVAHNVDEQVTP